MLEQPAGPCWRLSESRREWLRWLTEKGRPAQIVYLSPAFMVLLTAESWLSEVYRELASGLVDLHLGAPPRHYHMRYALSDLRRARHRFSVVRSRELRAVARPGPVAAVARAHRESVRDAHRVWRRNMKATPSYSEGFEASASVLRGVAGDRAYQRLSLRLIRGGQERNFEGEMARGLLTAEPSVQSAAQLHAISALAGSLAVAAPESGRGATETLRMDVDSRRDLTESGHAAVLEAVAWAEGGRMSLMELAQYLRELARAHGPG